VALDGSMNRILSLTLLVQRFGVPDRADRPTAPKP
jgi:hypothetical protein